MCPALSWMMLESQTWKTVLALKEHMVYKSITVRDNVINVTSEMRI